MTFLPTRRDDNGHVLTGHGSGMYTKRFASIDTTGEEIFLEVDSKTSLIHQEGSTVKMYVKGDITGSVNAYLTSDGITLENIEMAIPGSVSVWSDTLGTAENLANYTVRQIMAAADRSFSGNYVRLTFTAQAAQALVIDNVSIVERLGSTDDGVATPTEVLFQGSSGFSILAGASITSDELAFRVDRDKDYLVCMDIGATGQINKVTTGGAGYYTKAATNSYDTATIAGTATVAAGTANITKMSLSDLPTTICWVSAPADTIDVSVVSWR